MTASHAEFDRPVRGRPSGVAGPRPELERRAVVLLGALAPLTIAQVARGLGTTPQHAREVLFALEGRGHVVHDDALPGIYTTWTRAIYRLRLARRP